MEGEYININGDNTTMEQLIYNGNTYHVFTNTKLASLFNLAYCGIIFIQGTCYKKYTDFEGVLYLIEY